MATGISPKLPLTPDADDGLYKLNKTLAEAIQQNLKNLVLTNPGERIMDPLFGVGLKRYIFEQNLDSVYTIISETIREQTAKYMPFIDILEVQIYEIEDSGNAIKVSIEYKILPLDINDILNITEPIN